MQLRVSPGQGLPLYLQIVRQVKHLVASGQLSPGQQLPPVRKLAEELVVNPNTVARAYRELEGDGVLATRRGAGVFLSRRGSRLARAERRRMLTERADALLVEASHLGFTLDDVMQILDRRARRLLPEVHNE